MITQAELAASASGNVYTTGNYAGSVDFDPGPGTDIFTSIPGVSNVFIQKMDANGNYIWARSLGQVTVPVLLQSQWMLAGNIHITGTFRGQEILIPALAPLH